MPTEPPIQNVDCIDIMGKRHDGGADLVVVVSGPLDGSQSTISALRQKVRNYVAEAMNPAFQRQNGIAGANDTRILIVCEHPVDDLAHAAIDELREYAREFGIAVLLQRTALQ
jgi:hypothetical protein